MDLTPACVVLNMLPGIGPLRVKALLEHFDQDIARLFENKDRLLFQELAGIPKIGPSLAKQIFDWKEHVDLESELKLIEEANVTVLTLFHKDYPPLLREIYDPPIVLYVQGQLQAPQDHCGLGMVGGRKPSFRGEENAKQFAFQLAQQGVTIISGLARGIDTASHLGAIAAKGRTIGVLGSGLGEMYPEENRPLAEKIVQGHFGAVISEFPMTKKPSKYTFPMRNRIISGCSQGVVIVEASEKSGSLITATLALEQSRNVFAIPGPIHQFTCTGSNKLIQEGAKMVLGVEDILEDLNLDKLQPTWNQVVTSEKKDSSPLSPAETSVYAAMDEQETSIDQIIENSKLDSAQVTSALLLLELKNVVKQLSGKYYVKII